MTQNEFLGIARCINRKCGFGFGIVDEETHSKILARKIKCPCCGNRLEVQQ